MSAVVASVVFSVVISVVAIRAFRCLFSLSLSGRFLGPKSMGPHTQTKRQRTSLKAYELREKGSFSSDNGYDNGYDNGHTPNPLPLSICMSVWPPHGGGGPAWRKRSC